MSKKILKTQIVKSAIEEKRSFELFEFLRDNIEWEEGIRSKSGFTRLAKAIDLEEHKDLEIIINTILKSNFKLNCVAYAIYGVYLNYYKDGSMWTPNHSHPGTHQLVISLGETRKLVIGKKEVQMKSGDAILFGSSIHGVPKEENKGGRISIATFMKPIYEEELA